MSTDNERDNKENPTAKPASSTNDKLNDAAKTAGAMASKVFAKAKDAAADVKKELGNVNDIRKETFANAEAGSSKKDLAKGFWAKLSGKQKGLIAGLAAICIFLSYSLLFSGGSSNMLATPEEEKLGIETTVCASGYTMLLVRGRELNEDKNDLLRIENKGKLALAVGYGILGEERGRNYYKIENDRLLELMRIREFKYMTEVLIKKTKDCDSYLDTNALKSKAAIDRLKK